MKDYKEIISKKLEEKDIGLSSEQHFAQYSVQDRHSPQNYPSQSHLP